MAAPVRSTTRAELNSGEISSLNQSRATPGARASTLPLGGSDRTTSACALAGWASSSMTAATPRATTPLRRRIRTAGGPLPLRVDLVPQRTQLSLDDDVLHLGVAEHDGYLTA